MAIPHLLVDFGEVISVAQPADEVAALAALAELPVPEFSRRYWAHRPAYDEAALVWLLTGLIPPSFDTPAPAPAQRG